MVKAVLVGVDPWGLLLLVLLLGQNGLVESLKTSSSFFSLSLSLSLSNLLHCTHPCHLKVKRLLRQHEIISSTFRKATLFQKHLCCYTTY